MSVSLLNILTEARALIEERGVTVGEYYTGYNFDQVTDRKVTLPDDACLCMAGALHYAARSWFDDEPVDFLAKFLPEDFYPTRYPASRVFKFNDTHADDLPAILAIFDKAIAHATAENL